MVLRRELIVSLVLHAAVLIIAAGSFVSVSAPPPSKPVAVSIVTPSELSRLKAGKKSARKEQTETETAVATNRQEKADARKVRAGNNGQALAETKHVVPAKKAASKRVAPARPPPRDVAETTAQAVPVPSRAERPVPRRQEHKRKSPPRVKQEHPDQIADKIRQPPKRARYREEKERFDPDRIAALLNRDPNARPEFHEADEKQVGAPWRKPRSLEEQAFGEHQDEAREQRPAYGSPDGRDERMSANEIDAFRAQISRCWTPPVGGLGGDRIIVKLRIGLREDGSLAHPPAVTNRIASPFFRPAAESAMRAVMQCQPYRMPPEKYDQWRDMLLTFDPREMYGG